MRIFKIPFDTKREEKIFGGYLSVRQVIYIILAGISFLIAITPIINILKIIIITISVIFFLACAFIKIKEQNFDRFFFYAIKYLFRKKIFVYERCQKW